MTAPTGNGEVPLPETAATTAPKPKRVRTGCLTCRERHLKCDEGLPICQNCRKSNRACKRGLRLNFIDTQVQTPPQRAPTQEWKIDFVDESREIASEYVGGLDKYGARPSRASIAQQQHHHHHQAPRPQDVQAQNMPVFEYNAAALANAHAQVQAQAQAQAHAHAQAQAVHASQVQQAQSQLPPSAPSMSYQPLPSIQGMLPEPYPSADDQQQQAMKYDAYNTANHSNQDSPYSNHNAARNSISAYSQQQEQEDPNEGRREFLTTQEETLFMQVFVEEVGLWMDSMDPMKHFSRLLPFHSLGEPMLLNAFLACGARHLTLVNPAYSEEKALHYYDTATRYLLKNLQNPNRDTIVCATTAVILNVYEIMSERALQRMNHIAGARALIKECGWNARSQGVGSACFWLNVGLEVLSCLHFNWQVAWDPDDWGIDMDFTREIHNGREEVWTHRMLYIVAKVANFRATIPRHQENDPRDQEMRRQNRYAEWQKLKAWTDAWNENIPRTMHPMAYLYPQETSSKSCFPEVWLIKRTTIVARLFYHTVMVLLAQIHPYLGIESPEMHDMQRRHAQMVCGITAHVKDRGVASVAIRSLAHAAECLTDRREQEEVLQIFSKINKETGWRIAFVYKELKEKWNWHDDPPQPAQVVAPVQQNATLLQSPTTLQQTYGQQYPGTMASVAAPASAPPAPAYRRPPSGIINPMFANADFTMSSHPYQNVYVAPNPVSNTSTLYYQA